MHGRVYCLAYYCFFHLNFCAIAKLPIDTSIPFLFSFSVPPYLRRTRCSSEKNCPISHIQLDAVLLLLLTSLSCTPDGQLLLMSLFLILPLPYVARHLLHPVSASETNPRCQIMYVSNCSTTDLVMIRHVTRKS
jgi:hypothetical protein